MRLMMNLTSLPGLFPDLTRFVLYTTLDTPWEFDWTSASIGAGIMLILAIITYLMREPITEIWEKVIAPITAMQKHSRASKEEKYLGALLTTLQTQLSYMTGDAPSDFQSPQFKIPTPLPLTLAEAAKPTETVYAPFNSLLKGHNKLIMTGDFASGRTRAMVTLVQNINAVFAEGGDLERLPVWLDLSQFTLPEQDGTKPDKYQLGSVAQQTVSSISAKWISQTMAKRPTLVLVDNWELLSTEKRTAFAEWLQNQVEQAADAYWIVASEGSGYGPLTELGFVPIALQPNTNSNAIYKLYTSWIRELGIQRDLDEDVADAFEWIAKAGAGLEELTSRIILYIKTEDVPDSPGAVAEALFRTYLPIENTNADLDATWDLAQNASMDILTHIAGEIETRDAIFTRQAVAQLITEHMPPKTERPPRLEPVMRKMLQNCSLLQRTGKQWTIIPGYWRDYLLARYLAEHEHGLDYIEAHLEDISWQRAIEFYASKVDISSLLEPVLEFTNATGNVAVLRKLVRIALISPEDFALRNPIIKAIAALFMDAALPAEDRLALGQSLAQIAGGGARAFFMQMLRSPALQVRSAALRGIGWCGTPQDLKILAAALRHKDENIQTNAIYGMRDLGTPGATTFLGKALEQVNEGLMPVISAALADMPDGDKLLEEISWDDDLMMRRSAVYGLGRLAHRRQQWAYDMLVKLAREDSEWLVRSAAESQVADIDEVYAQEVVVTPPPQVDTIDWLMAWAARQNLGLGVGDAAMKTLLKAVDEGNSDVKILAAKTFAQIGRKEHLDVLSKLTLDSDPLVVQIATLCVEEIETRYRFPVEIKPVVMDEPVEEPGNEETSVFIYDEPGGRDEPYAESVPDDIESFEQKQEPDSEAEDPPEEDGSGNVFT